MIEQNGVQIRNQQPQFQLEQMVLRESNLRFLFAVFYPNLHIILNFALDQATACLRRLICLTFRRFGFKPV